MNYFKFELITTAARKHLGFHRIGRSTRMHIKNYDWIKDDHIVVHMFDENQERVSHHFYMGDVIEKPLAYDEPWIYGYESDAIRLTNDELSTMKDELGEFNAVNDIDRVVYKVYHLTAELDGSPDAGFNDMNNVDGPDLEYLDMDQRRVPIKFHPPR